MKVLLSIKPEFAEKIFSGEKKYEYRKIVFKKNVTSIVLYATLPVGRIVGEFEIEKILHKDPSSLWEQTKDFSGISESFFCEYFLGKKCGYAIKIGAVKKYSNPILPQSLFERFVAPQSFKYIEGL